MKKHLLLSAALLTAASAFAQDYLSSDYYVIGTNVNGQYWTQAADDAKFESLGNGVFQWKGEVLGNGFKINNGSWEDLYFDFGVAEDIVLGERYVCEVGGLSENISFAGNISILTNPTVTLNVSQAPEEVTIVVTGEPHEAKEWYFSGSFNNWAIDDAPGSIMFTDLGGGLFEIKDFEFSLDNETAQALGYNTFKVSTTGWGIQYGDAEYLSNGIVFNDWNNSGYLDRVKVDYGECAIYLEGKYDIRWDANNHYITFTKAGTTPKPNPDSNYLNATYYIVGTNVNGQNWALGAEDAIFENKGGGIFEWRGEVLGSGFKFNNGNWDDDRFNIGAALEDADPLVPGEAYNCVIDPWSQDIMLADGIAEIKNPVVILNVSNAPDQVVITVTGDCIPGPEAGYFNQNYYVIGSNVNGQTWTLAADDAKFENKGNGIFEWNGEVLGTGFKINNGSWTYDEYNIGGYEPLVPGEAYYCELTGQDIMLANNVEEIRNPKVILNVANAPEQIIITVIGDYDEPIPVPDNEYLNQEYYMIGSNVNDKSWSLGQADCKFENKGGGIFEWNGEYLGTGFKINNGTWDDDRFNIGAGSELLSLGEPYYCEIGGWTGNFIFDEADGVRFAGLKNPKVILNVANAPDEVSIIVSGEKDGLIKWYFTGTFNNWAIDNYGGEIELMDLGNKMYEAKGVQITSATAEPDTGYNTFKIVTTGWMEQYGSEGGNIEFGAGVDTAILERVEGGEGACPLFYDGTYDILWDLNTHRVTFTESGVEPTPDVDYLNADYYILGNNVNGQEWILAAEDAKFENKGNGIFEWRGEVLGSGFKINNGSWDNEAFNIGGPKEFLVPGCDYTCKVGVNNYNIYFPDETLEIKNPVVTLDVSNAPEQIIIKVDGDNASSWGLYGYIDNRLTTVLLEKTGENQYVANGVKFLSANEEYGANNWFVMYDFATETFFGPMYDNTSIYVTETEPSAYLNEGGQHWCNLTYNGVVDVVWHPETQIIEFTKTGDVEIEPLKWYIEGNINGEERTRAELLPVGDNKFVAENVRFTENAPETLVSNRFYINSSNPLIIFGAVFAGGSTDNISNYIPQLLYGVTSAELNFQGEYWCYCDFYGSYTVEWDAKTHYITFTKEGDEPLNEYTSQEYYMIGSNVNGKSWELAQEDAKFVYKGNGIFEWNGDVLGTGFKINNGSWDFDEFNFGSVGEALELGQPYYCAASGNSGNISFAGNFTELKNPKVILNVSNAPNDITIIVTGEQEGTIKWYISGTFNGWAIDKDADAIELKNIGDTLYEAKGVEFTDATVSDYGYNTFKIVTTGWANQYGSGESGVEIDSFMTEATLDLVDGEGGACPIYLTGKYDVLWDAAIQYVTFTESKTDAVSELNEADEAEVMYFTPDGIRVPEPSEGLYIKVQGTKVTKVIL